SLEQRVEFALCLADLNVDSIPLNFLVPVEGTKLAQVEPMNPLDILRIIAMFRLICPEAEIKVCAGREQHLRSLQSLIFYAGATGMMIGGYLTVAGRPLEEDISMLNDLQVEYE
ncbi:MAG: biotin synthase BioB, partial [Phycisphaerae bacterium]|nr:biotin synthase BioB [Phycisphaerae bacterium]